MRTERRREDVGPTRPGWVVATAGHVDHGKSTLVRALTGMEPDRWAEERRRGMTIDLGFAWTTTADGRTVAFVDVPGHARFVTTMLAGAGPVPAVLFVVAADAGWMPQSAEHLDALAALGVRDGLVVITRSDLADPGPAREQARAHLAGTPLRDLPAVCVSATTGSGMDDLRAALGELGARLPDPDPAADVRFWIDRAFTIDGAGTVVTGTLGGGRIRVGDELELRTAQGARRVTVRGVASLGVAVAEATGVARVAVNLRGTPRAAVSRGDVLLTPAVWPATDLLDVRLLGGDTSGDTSGDTLAPHGLPAELTLHFGSVAVPVRVRPLGRNTVRLRLRRPLPLRIGDRAVLRDPGAHRVRAGLVVLDVAPPELRRRGAAAVRAAVLDGMDGVPSAAAELARRGVARRAELRAMGSPVADLDALARGVPAAAGWLVDPGRAAQLAVELAAAVAAHEATDPLEPGLPVEAARRAVGLPDPRLVGAVLGHAARRPAGAERVGIGQVGAVLRGGRVLGPPRELPAEVRAGLDALRAELGRDRFAAPSAVRLRELGLGPRRLAALVEAGELVRLADGIVLLPDAPTQALAALATLGPEFTLSAARQALGTTRRVAVPLLESLARAGLTTRTPDGGHRLVPARLPPIATGRQEWQPLAVGPTVWPMPETRANQDPPSSTEAVTTGADPYGSAESDDQIVLSTRPAADGQVVIEVAGEVDMLTSPQLRSLVLAQFAPDAGVELVVLHLDDVTFLGTSGLAALIEIREAAHRAGVELRLACTERRVLRPLTIAGLVPLFDIHDSIDLALTAT